MASIGAIVTVLSLGIDPIVQQTLSVGIKVVNSTSPATFGRAQSFVQWDIQDFSVADGYDTPGLTEDFSDPRVLLPPNDMVAAMFEGMFSDAEDLRTSSGSFDQSLSCPTGNCTFQPFQTLSVCSECGNLANELRYEQCYSQPTGGLHGPPSVVTFCEYSLPNGLKLNQTFGPTSIASNGSLLPVSPPPSSLSIFNFTSIKSGIPLKVPAPSPGYDLDEMGQENEAALKTSNITAIQCFLYWCVDTLQAEVMSGQVSETKLDSWYNRTMLQPDVPVAGILTSGLVGDIWTLKPPSLNANNFPSDFVIARYASQALHDWLEEHLTITNSRSFVAASTTYSATDPHHRQYEQQRLLLNTNITVLFEKLAASMSRGLRRTSTDVQKSSPFLNGRNGDTINVTGVGPANGTATSREIFVVVHWHWLAFPVALWLTTLVFFGLTLLSTSRHQLEVWKLSPFPLILNRVDDSLLTHHSETLSRMHTVKIPDLERRAAGLSVRFEEADVGPRLTTFRSQPRYTPLPEDSDCEQQGIQSTKDRP